MKIGIIVAMDKEFEQLKSILDHPKTERHHFKDFVTGEVGDKEIILQKCGIGKVNSAIGAVEMINRYQPNLIISSGCAGGADTSLKMMDVVVARECVYHDVHCGSNAEKGQIIGMPTRYKAPDELLEKALSLNNGDSGEMPKVRAGLTVSGDYFVDNKEKMRSILTDFPEALAVDMESCSIAQVCHVYHTPFISFRVISDVPLNDTDANMYFDFWARVAEGSFEVTKHFLNTL
ncbi:5'-methylthioadenosine/adenosylhomocysteine nucleosidase [Prevotella brunnea]|uniref:adenosylhomocysteine nucleosidase n=1 Tax=Prevotella brunnea TaxID=2508867 RepID=A0A5C8GL54_9BACT|nr:5'-methylthioadenosine/adenosylhomocysteine nucleosidase [Prevotella brunnea]MDR0187016.1 5'-methylthioadenosine/adenosylhomocysteine nucleosidase [Prevotella brunnea]TXJ62867.1 5'-methylthioadenosine/adenosylhomocysteine nucleosidase [Prevotella brunnea]